MRCIRAEKAIEIETAQTAAKIQNTTRGKNEAEKQFDLAAGKY